MMIVPYLALYLSQHDEKHVLPTPLSGVRVEKLMMIVLHLIIIKESEYDCFKTNKRLLV
jgi:hypothetical protein